MTTSPRVSILSAVRNEELYIEEMITSVQAQSLRDWELIFCDDGSTDRTRDLLESAESGDNRIMIVGGSSHEGKVAAFNQAFQASRGQVVILLGGDDRLTPDSLKIRYSSVARRPANTPVVSFFKLKTISESPKFDGIVLPRGRAASRSGGSITMNRNLAEILFPIDERLISEDIWLSYGATALAKESHQSESVVLEYRIHAANSNPRHKAFEEMSESMHARQLAFRALLDCSRLPLPEAARKELQERARAEVLRYEGRTMSVLSSRLPVVERLAIASMSRPVTHFFRSRYFRLFSGWRGR